MKTAQPKVREPEQIRKMHDMYAVMADEKCGGCVHFTDLSGMGRVKTCKVFCGSRQDRAWLSDWVACGLWTAPDA